MRIAKELPVNSGRILITGASGLIGTCLVDVFQIANDMLDCSFEIYALGRNIDRLNSKFSASRDVHCVAQNIVEPVEIEGLTHIIHTASNADPRSYALYPAETILTNVIGAKSVLDYCKNSKNTRVLFTSTFEVYGKLDQDEYGEDDFGIIDNKQLRYCYSESKRTAEFLFRSYHDEYGVDCVIARLSSIYGPTMLDNDSKAHAQFLRNALNSENIVLKSEGKQKRTYCYVMDAVSGLLAVLFKGTSGEAYNIANDKSVATIAEVAQTIADIAGTKVIFDLPDGIESKGFSKPQNVVLKTDKLKSLGWSGKYTLLEGLTDTLAIMRSNI
ncbi:MAG: NAD-dependent epimerase/dehydratase family protein [Clostridiales bacterium]|nr:NAD-dependent epimerase/dehydratase family protein [Clostridiales bacterium]MBR3248009.1 NAD-dependent epimerase/dehydratase family protein [Clostridiales bacterium]